MLLNSPLAILPSRLLNDPSRLARPGSPDSAICELAVVQRVTETSTISTDLVVNRGMKKISRVSGPLRPARRRWLLCDHISVAYHGSDVNRLWRAGCRRNQPVGGRRRGTLNLRWEEIFSIAPTIHRPRLQDRCA